MKINSVDDVKKWLNLVLKILWTPKKLEWQNLENIKNIFIDEISKAQMKNWQVLWPVRCALSWEEFSPGALELIYILWVEESIKRIEKVLSNF
jgi:glutamyl/glutaminyl-tRNA synthetase